MKHVLCILHCLSVLFFGAAGQAAFAQGPYNLTWSRVEGLDLPPSVQVYETSSPLSDSLPFHAVYTLVDLNDPNIRLKARYVGDNKARMTPEEFAGLEEEPVFVAVNGGFFSSTRSVSLVVEEGKVLAPGLQGLRRASTDSAAAQYYPARGAFGVWENKKMDISWAYADPDRQDSIFSYATPRPLAPVKDSARDPAGGFSPKEDYWNIRTAMGGIPVLISQGELLPLDKEMAGSSLNARHPRTAVGYTSANQMILLVVDGRQEEHSRGATLRELGQIMLELGAYEALNLDGGGSSALMAASQLISKPSDVSGTRPVAAALLLTRQAQIFDTEDEKVYKETGPWVEDSASSSYGTSKTRLLATGNGPGKALYTLPDIPPARYELSAWWARGEGTSANTPFIIRRSGLRDSLVSLRLDQAAESTVNRFNYVGTFDLGPGDRLIISNEAEGEYVAVDAIRLRKTGESRARLSFPGGDERGDVARQTTLSIPLKMQSPNTGVKLKALRVYKSVDGGPEERLETALPLEGKLTVDHTFTYFPEEEAGSVVSLRFELEDNFGRKTSGNYEVRIMDFALVFEPNRAAGLSEAGRELSFGVRVEREGRGRLRQLQIYKSVNQGKESLYQVVPLSGKRTSFRFSYLGKESPGDTVRFRFSALHSSGKTAERTYEAKIVPAKGSRRIAFISDINSSYGSTNYSRHAKEAIQWIADPSHRVELVLGSGDFIAGQSRSLEQTRIEAMWSAFGRYVFDPIRQAGIPFGFSLGNHDSNLELDRQVARAYWKQDVHQQDLKVRLIDSTDYPFRYTFTDPSAAFFVLAVDLNTTDDQLQWVETALQSPEAKKAKYVFVSGHFPLFALTKVYNSQEGVQPNYQALFELFKKYEVDLFFSGHHAAYFPGKKKELFLLSVGEMGGDGRDYVGSSRQAPSTLSIMDVFEGDPVYGDSLVLTTYDIQNNFRVVKNETLPAAVFAFNGYTLRRDIAVSTKGSGRFSSLNLNDAFNGTGGGDIQLWVEGDQVRIEGTFQGLEGELLAQAGAVVLCQGLHPDSKELLKLEVQSADGKSGSFKGVFKPEDIVAFKELMSIGNYSVLIKTSHYPGGEIRSQVYPVHNQAPQAPLISSHSEGEVYGVRDLIAYFPIRWEAAADPESDRLTYLYQLAADPQFEQIIWQQSSGRSTEFKRTEQEWYSLTDSLETSTFYQRVVATDGRNIAYGASKALQLRRDDRPLTELVEIPAPEFRYQGIFAKMGGGGKGYDIAAFDKNQRLWATAYSAGLYVYNADGRIHRFSSPKLKYTGDCISHLTFKGETYRLNPAYGVEIAPDGHIILAAGGQLFKLHVESGEATAHWGGGAGSNPTVDQEGRVLVHKVFPAKAAWILKQSEADTSTFEVLAKPVLDKGPGVARTSAFAPEGNSLYLPDASASRKVYKYKGEDGLHFTFDQLIEMAFPTGSNAIYAGPEETVYVVANRGAFTPDLLFVDFRNNYFWRISLDDIPVSDLRGFTVTADGNALFLTGTGADIYHYKLEEQKLKGSLQPEGVGLR